MSWTLQQQFEYTSATSYQHRIYFAFLKTANDIRNEASNTTNHVARLALAEKVINGDGPPKRAVMLLHVLNPALQVDGGEPTDNDLLFTISQQWDFFTES